MENQINIVARRRLGNMLRDVSSLSVSDAATERVQIALNLFAKAIAETAAASAIYNNRKTLMKKDVDVALEGFYNYLHVFDELFSEEDDF